MRMKTSRRIRKRQRQNLVLFSGGVDVGDVDAKAHKLEIPVFLEEEAPDVRENILKHLLFDLTGDKQQLLLEFIQKLYSFYVRLYFTYLEINPLGE